MSQSVPKPSAISAPFWEACHKGVLRIQQCADCATHVYYPAYMCPNCSSLALEWVDISGRATIYSLTRIENPVSAASGTTDPLIVALIELAEGPVMMSNVVGEDAFSALIGDAVEVDFQPVSDDISLPVFRRVATGEAA